MSKLGLVEDLLSFATKGAAKEAPKAAPKVAKPFYSAADKAAMELTRGKGTGKEFITELKKAPGVKKAELEHRKLEQIEAMPKMTKEEFLAELEKRPPAQIEETVRRNPTEQEWNDIAERLMEEEATAATNDEIGKLTRYNRGEWEEFYDDTFEGMLKYRRDEFLDQARALAQEGELPEAPKFDRSDLKLPGGENYREILLRLPSFRPSIKTMSRADYNKAVEAADKAGIQNYQGSHWEEPNVLAHARVVDRIGPHGEKILHVEEVQSDWHQAGRKKGYKSDVNPEENKELVKQWDALANERRNLERIIETGDDANPVVQNAIQRHGEVSNELNAVNDRLTQIRTAFREGVPDAPFKKNWHELTMKRLLNYAAEHGYDKVAITPGAEQASRYDLSKHINEINYGKNLDGTYSLTAIDKNGRPAINNMRLSEQELENTVGKEIAQKIIEGQGAEFPAGSVSEGKRALSGLDLQVGGEGMIGFYDKMLPDYLNTFGKKYGVGVGKMGVVSPLEPRGIEDLNDLLTRRGISSEDYAALPQEQRVQLLQEAKDARTNNMVNLHSFDITPEMREEIKGGMPLYQKIGIPTGAGAAGQQLEEPQEPEEPKLAGGGLVGEEYDPDQSDGGLVVHDSAAFKRGGKVKISDNADAMFLELRDKELNRK